MELLLPLVGIALLWFFLIRPASRRQKDLVRMQSALGVGDEVMLTSGVFGTVTELADDHLRVEVAPGVVLKVVRGAIGRVLTDADRAMGSGGLGEPRELGATQVTDSTDITDEER